MTVPGEPVELVVGEDDAGQRIDRVLAAVVGSRSQAARAIAEGRVTVDGSLVHKRHQVVTGERVSVEPEAPPAPEVAVPSSSGLRVAFEDESLLVVDKPAGMVVHPARGHQQGTLAQLLAGRAAGGEDPARAGIVHRLDRDTSGLLVVAKSQEAHRVLKAELAARELRREYLAMVEGLPGARSGTIDSPIGRDRRDRKLVSIETDVPREAVTHFEILRSLGPVSLLRVVLDTGRTHQIRAHMSAIGHPVAGDAAYGGGAWFGLTRQFLHAARLSFAHPVTGELVDVRSELPEDLAVALQGAEREFRST